MYVVGGLYYLLFYRDNTEKNREFLIDILFWSKILLISGLYADAPH